MSTVSAGAGFAGTVTVDGGESTGVPPGGVPVAVAEFDVDPRSTSACVNVYVAVKVVDPPGASVATEDGETGPNCPDPVNPESFTDTSERVTLPVLLTTNEYVIS
ncbi:conserved hypothetical protein [Massilia sp. 9I]|nr:conserved hypothetical protein [Massilia sp. 9I]VXB98031.1 conserved hypothetical protein [Curtobacterium sp. 8I-2]